MPVADLRVLSEHREFLAALPSRSDVAAIYALRYHRRLNCSRMTMRTFIGHYIDCPDSAVARSYRRVRKRPAAALEVDSLAKLYDYAGRLRAWIEQGLQDRAIVHELGVSAGVRCTAALVAKFRAHDQAAADIQRSWRAYAASLYQPAGYEEQPEHDREFQQGDALLD